jgi:hypothetical protein
VSPSGDVTTIVSPEDATARNAAEEEAKKQAALTVENQATAKQNATMYDMYSVARDNLRKSLGVPLSGPLVGYLPAITKDAQSLDRAGRIMLPIIKNLMRTAGEGTQDQREFQALIDLIPGRDTDPSVGAANLDVLDKIVRIKLGAPLVDDGGQQPTGQAKPTTKTINGTTYVQKGGEWYAQ